MDNKGCTYGIRCESTRNLAIWYTISMGSLASFFGFQETETLNSFSKMWYHIFLWTFFSSFLLHAIAALIAFITLHKHKYGKFFPVVIQIMGLVIPIISGVVSSAAIALVYRFSSFPMHPVYAFCWGIGQTCLYCCIGFTRILATL